MRDFLSILLGKFVYSASLLFNLGSGGTWPGEVALSVNPHLLSSLSKKLRQGVIIVAGTNGKTTTSLMIKKILEASGLKVIHNATGANLLNGIVSTFIKQVDWNGWVDADWGVFEVDENSLPHLLTYVKPRSIVLLNLFRDQLDRYGEVDVIAEKWHKALDTLNAGVSLILNADDPQIAHLGKKSQNVISSGARNLAKRKNITSASLPRSLTSFEMTNIVYFGIEDKSKFLKDREHATDSTFCLNCGGRLTYSGIYFSHLGIWKCTKCGETRPKPDISAYDSPLPGLYNLYNTLAAVSAAKTIGIEENSIQHALSKFTPAFGRQEEFEIDHKKIKLFLSKNPVGFNASLRTVLELKPKALLLVLNDRIPDGRDVSWIWDVDFETIPDSVCVVVSGDRTYDMAIRVKYAINSANTMLHIESNLEKALQVGLGQLASGETLFVMPTYSAMLEVRKIVSGRKIL